jgi:putative ABC transport system permease protein
LRPRGGSARVAALGTALQREVQKIDPNLPLYFVDTPKRQLEGQLAPNRVIATMFSIFGLVAVVLASVGIYGVMSFAVSQRKQEFGVRMALGADYGRILSMVLRQGTIQIALGLGVGLALTLGVVAIAGNGIQNTLFGVSARDPLIYGAVMTLVAGVSLIATFVPARRATRVDPMIALRAE